MNLYYAHDYINLSANNIFKYQFVQITLSNITAIQKLQLIQ